MDLEEPTYTYRHEPGLLERPHGGFLLAVSFSCYTYAMKGQTPPLAFRRRPVRIEDLMGQEEASALLEDFSRGAVRSAILWGPPGSGKTSVVSIIEHLFPEDFHAIQAVSSGVQEIRAVSKRSPSGKTPIVFIDEIHRFTRVQQDSLLPIVESAEVILVGATTENPSFALTPPLVSRTQVVLMKSLDVDTLVTILRSALEQDEILLSMNKQVADECIAAIARASDGDARAALNLLELAMTRIDKEVIEPGDIERLLKRPLYHDSSGEYHYDLISAFHKSVRAGDADASVYWLGRMLEAGEDRLFIVRRMIRIASEDIGLADPNALRMAVAARDAFTFVGSPEGELALYEVAIYLACAPKSNAVYLTEHRVRDLIRKTGTPEVPLHLRNAPTKLMRELGYGRGYIYPHDDYEGALDLAYMPESLGGLELYKPKDSGVEKRIKEILDARRKAQKAGSGSHRRHPRG
ncbi:MAG TPA: replication-associated recombination protein A [Deltaproteobacteria bacterium]|nr:replication-associated recombination protein A [Deltaproteobacteria bacterium]